MSRRRGAIYLPQPHTCACVWCCRRMAREPHGSYQHKELYRDVKDLKRRYRDLVAQGPEPLDLQTLRFT